MRQITWVLFALATGCGGEPVRPDVELTVSFHILSTGTGRIAAGLGGIDCPPDCVARFDEGSSVVLAVFPDPNSTFLSWSGSCSGTQPVLIQLDADLHCVARLNLKPQGGTLAPRGSLVFDHRIEAALLRNGLIWTAGFDLAEGNVVDISNPDNPSSGIGAEFSPCLGATGFTFFFSPLPQYLQDVIHTTCTSARAGTLAPTGNGSSQQETYAFEPGEVDVLSGVLTEVMVDFEFGQLRLVDRDVTPGMDVVIPLSNPLERSCPFDLTTVGTFAFVVGREGTVGTSTENCERWHGLWRVDLAANRVIGFTPFGTKLRDATYFAGFVFVADFEEDRVHMVDAATGTLDLSFPVGDGPTGLLIVDRPLGHDLLLVTLRNANRIAVFDLATKLELDNQPSGGIAPVKVFRDDSTLLVLNFGDTLTNTGAVIKAFILQ